MHPSEQEKVLENLTGQARLQTYRNSEASPTDLYMWNLAVSAELYILLGHLEIALRNHIDRALPPGWALPRQTPTPVYSLLRRSLLKAHQSAEALAQAKGRALSHDDVIAQLSFGSWCHLIGKSGRPDEHRQQELWKNYYAPIFKKPGVEEERIAVGQRLERLRKLRNRIAHHENLLQVNLPERLRDIILVLDSLDSRYTPFLLRNSRIEELISQDPRKS